MPSMDDVYGGSWLKAEDVPQNFRAVLTVEHVSLHTVGEGADAQRKLAVRFAGKEKMLLLNVTNANMLAEIAGSRDYDFWPGKRVLLYRTMTDFGGKRVAALRLDHVQANGGRPAAPPPPPPPPPVREPGDEFQATDDDCPF